MATNYTTILKLALPTQGENSGTWGDLVNNNITSMVEEAIAGRKVINTWTTNSHTLTTADGTTSESRAAMLEFTDTGTALTGAGSVICPAQSKIYVAKNAAGQAVTLKTSSGTGISIPDGETMLLFCDGTNVEQAVTNIASAKIGGETVTLGGTLTTADAFTTSGAYSLTLTATAATNVTLPTTGTLSTLAGTETLTNKTLTSPAVGTAMTMNGRAELRFGDGDTSNYIGFEAPATVSSNQIWVLPDADGTADQILKTDGSGTLSFGDAAAGTDWADVSDYHNLAPTTPGNYGMSVGYGAAGTGIQSIALGYKAKASGANAINISAGPQSGTITDASGSDSIVIGTQSEATADATIAIGDGASADAARSIAIGRSANVSNTSFTDSVAIGNLASVGLSNQLMLGTTGDTNGFTSIRVGNTSYSPSDNYDLATKKYVDDNAGGAGVPQDSDLSTAVSRTGTDSMAIGSSATATATRSTAIGISADATGIQTTAIGQFAEATADGTCALGYDTLASATYAVAVGRGAEATGVDAIAMGYLAKNDGANSIVLGSNITVQSDLDNSVVLCCDSSPRGGKVVIIGTAATVGTSTSDSYAIAVGYDARASQSGTVCLGSLADATGTSAIALGTAAQATATDALGVGYNAHAEHSNATAIGHDSATNAANSFHLGNSSISDLRCQDTSITAVSDERDKIEIEDLAIGLDFVNDVTPKSFYKNNRNNYFDNETREFDQASYEAGTEKNERLEFGWVAQQVAAALEETAGYEDARLTFNETEYFSRATRGDDTETREEKMDVQRFTPGDMVPILWKAVQELSAKNDELEARIAALES